MLSSAATGVGAYPHQQQPRGAAVFTAAQWAELEQQALIYKYLMAGVPVPPDLLLPIRPAFSFGPAASSLYHHHPSREFLLAYAFSSCSDSCVLAGRVCFPIGIDLVLFRAYTIFYY
jgi:hypothetical protein